MRFLLLATAGTLVLGLALVPSGCGHTPPRAEPWQEAMKTWFANGSVRSTIPPRRLWTSNDAELFLRRVGFADVVAVGRVRVVCVYSMFDTPKQLALAFRPDEVMHGSVEDLLDADGEMLLALSPHDEDFRLAVGIHPLLPGNRYVLMLKRKPSAAKKPELRFALYDPEPHLLAEIRVMFQWLSLRDPAQK